MASLSAKKPRSRALRDLYFCSGFFSVAFFCASAVQGGTIPFTAHRQWIAPDVHWASATMM
jgi:hypothetical protein